MSQAIAYQEPRHSVYKIIAGYLVERILANFHIRGFAFHQQYFFAGRIKYQHITAFLQAIVVQSAF